MVFFHVNRIMREFEVFALEKRIFSMAVEHVDRPHPPKAFIKVRFISGCVKDIFLQLLI